LKLRSIESDQFAADLMTGGKVVAAAKDWTQRLVDRASGVARNKVLIAAEALKPAMKPLRLRLRGQ
jgi:hypothetical protein